jgi:hypothetical protein
MSSPKDKDMDTTIDDLKSTEKKLEALKMEVARQEEMEVLKARIAQDTARLESLRKGDAKQYKPREDSCLPIFTGQETKWIENQFDWFQKAKCKVTGRICVFCMCGQCAQWRQIGGAVKLTKRCELCHGDDKDACKCSPCS